MTVKEIVSKIKTFLNEETTNTNLVDVKTKDGIILSYDGELVVGVEIFVLDESGRNPAPDGEYILEDGTALEVMGGKVEEIKAAEMPIEAPMPVEEMPVEAEKNINLEELTGRIDKLEADNVEMKKILTELAESFSKKEFEEEVKMSMVEPENQVLELSKMIEKPLNRNNELNSIFNNMYNKKLY